MYVHKSIFVHLVADQIRSKQKKWPSQLYATSHRLTTPVELSAYMTLAYTYLYCAPSSTSPRPASSPPLSYLRPCSTPSTLSFASFTFWRSARASNNNNINPAYLIPMQNIPTHEPSVNLIHLDLATDEFSRMPRTLNTGIHSQMSLTKLNHNRPLLCLERTLSQQRLPKLASVSTALIPSVPSGNHLSFRPR